MGNAGDVDIRNQITMQALARKIQAAALAETKALFLTAIITLQITTTLQAMAIRPLTTIRQAAAIPVTALHPAVRHQAAIMLLLITAPQAAAIPLEAIRQMGAATICPATAAIRQGVVATTRQAALAAICQATAASQKTAKTICPAAAATVPQEATTRLLTVRLPAAANPQPHRIQIPLLLPLQAVIRMP